jgi:hypothetical protein
MMMINTIESKVLASNSTLMNINDDAKKNDSEE